MASYSYVEFPMGGSCHVSRQEVLTRCDELDRLGKTAAEALAQWKPSEEATRKIHTCLQLQSKVLTAFMTLLQAGSSGSDIPCDYSKLIDQLSDARGEALKAIWNAPADITHSTPITSCLALQSEYLPSLLSYFSAARELVCFTAGKVPLQTITPWIGKRIQVKPDGSQQDVFSHKLDAMASIQKILYRPSKPKNAIYEGEKHDDMPHGLGKLTFYLRGYDKAGVYIGAFNKGQVSGEGTCTYPDDGVYKGCFAYGLPAGEGMYQFPPARNPYRFKPTLTYGQELPHGLCYVGGFKSDSDSSSVFSGQGKITLENRQTYEGQWNGGNPYGQGRLTFPDGSYITAEFTAGRLAGWASIAYMKDAKTVEREYIGQVDTDGHPHGYGWLPLTQNVLYEGNFVHGHPQGYGSLSYSGGLGDNLMYFEGQFERGVALGHGTLSPTWSRNTYSGQFYPTDSKSAPEGALFYEKLTQQTGLIGFGTITFPNGDVYVGQMRNGSAHGQGTLTKAKGKVVTGEFEAGEPPGCSIS